MPRTFNGTTDKLVGTLSTGLGSSLTVSAWIRSGGSLKDGGLVQSHVASYDNYWFYLFTQAGAFNRFGFALYDGTNNPNVYTATSSYATNTVYHIVGVRDVVADTINIYRNGTSVTPVTDSTTSTPTYSEFNIGYVNRSTNTEFWNGNIGHVTVWNAALSAGEIQGLSRGINPNLVRRANLIRYIPMMDTSTGMDLSGNNGTMTVTGTTSAPHFRVGRYVPFQSRRNTIVYVQMARPDGDSAIGSWTDQAGGTTNIYASIDEASPASDSDYIQSEKNPATNSKYVATLSDVTDPNSSVGHIVRYRYRKDNTDQTINITVRLKQGVTTIASATHSGVSTTWTNGSFTLSAAEADSITDYSDLRIEFEADVP